MMHSHKFIDYKIKTFGFSMAPLLHDQDIVYIRKIKFSQIKINDIITVQKNKALFTHRVIYVGESFIITKGDNNLVSDGKIFPRQIKGIVYKVKRSDQKFTPEDIYLQQSTLYFQEILKIVKVFAKKKIEYTFLKGLPLYLYIEKLHPKRIYADCDVLIKENHLFIAVNLLKNLGFKRLDNALTVTHRKFRNRIAELSFYKYINGWPVIFDIHIDAFSIISQIGEIGEFYPYLDIKNITEQFLSEKTQVNIQGEVFPILSLSNLILYLSIHFFKHNYTGSFRLELLNRIVRENQSKIQWKFIETTTRNYHLCNFIYPVFVLLIRYYKTPIPNNFMKIIQPHGGKLKYIKENILNKNIFDDKSRTETGVVRFKYLFHLSSRSLIIKLFVFFNPAVIYSIYWILKNRLIARYNFIRF